MGVFGGQDPLFDHPSKPRHEPCTHQPVCPHCDREMFDPQTCSHCAAIHWGTIAAVKVLDTRPQPEPWRLHDSRPDTYGAVGRCQHCGGRTYHTGSGPWCPRAGCPTGAAT